jgi:type IV pilus assembly protein PilM
MPLDIIGKFGLRTIDELLGIDIGTTSIKICELKKTRTGFILQNVAKKTYENDLLNDGIIIDNTLVANELKSLIAANNFKSRDVACALSSYTVIIKRVTIPFMADEVALENTITMEVENVIPFPLRDIYFSYFVMGVDEEKPDMMKVQIVAAKKEIVDGFVQTLEMAGLRPQILDVDVFGLTNLVEQLYNPQDMSVVAVDLGAAVTNIAILRGEGVEFTREILMGGKYITNLIQNTTNLSYADAEEKKLTNDSSVSYLFEDFIFNISSEIKKTINFYLATRPNETLGKIYITGGSSLLPGLKERVYEETQMPIESINPFLILGEEESKIQAYDNLKEYMVVALYLSSRIGDLTA